MTWSSRTFRILPTVLSALVLAGCTEIAYVSHSNPEITSSNPEANRSFGRQVDFHLARPFYEQPPKCVMVMPTRIKGQTVGVSPAIDDAVGRHLTSRFDRVISARHIAAKLRELAMDAEHKDDRRNLGHFGCRTPAESLF